MHSTRNMVYIAVFGGLWGGSEIFLGSILYTLQIPMYGVLMAGIGVVIVLTGRLFAPVRGSILSMGIVAAFLKLFSIGNIALSPLAAILIEACLGEAVISLSGRSRVSFAAAGSLMVVYCLFHRFLSQVVFYGRGIVDVYSEFARMASGALGIGMEHVVLVILVFVLLYAVIGSLAGILAWRVGNRALQQMGMRAS